MPCRTDTWQRTVCPQVSVVGGAETLFQIRTVMSLLIGNGFFVKSLLFSRDTKTSQYNVPYKVPNKLSQERIILNLLIKNDIRKEYFSCIIDRCMLIHVNSMTEQKGGDGKGGREENVS